MTFGGRSSNANRSTFWVGGSAGLRAGQHRPETSPFLRKEVFHPEERINIASRLSETLNTAFSSTFGCDPSERILVSCQGSTRAYQFIVYYDARPGFVGHVPEAALKFDDFRCSGDFLNNVSDIAPKNGFGHLYDFRFLELGFNSEVEITDSITVASARAPRTAADPALGRDGKAGGLTRFIQGLLRAEPISVRTLGLPSRDPSRSL